MQIGLHLMLSWCWYPWEPQKLDRETSWNQLPPNDNFNRDVHHSSFVILCGQASEFLGNFFQTLCILFRRFSPPPHLSKKFAGSCTTFANPENSSADLYACRCPHVSISRKLGSYLFPILAFTFVFKKKKCLLFV